MAHSSAREKAAHFVRNETAFHLGALPTEQAHPKTATLSTTLQTDLQKGIVQLLSVDSKIPPVAERCIESPAFYSLVTALLEAMRGRRRIFFTGCGATGRLSILLDAAWRECWQRLKTRTAQLGRHVPDLEDLTTSIMAGGDYALIRSVEGFEDFPGFGRRQLRESGVGEGDVVVAITEGGETSFVIGTAWQGLEAGAKVFFVFNNPADALAAHVERSREVIEDGRITLLDLATGPMAIAGSTRMQATTIELLVVGAAIETALRRFIEDHLGKGDLEALDMDAVDPREHVAGFTRLLGSLQSPEALRALAGCVRYEADVYSAGGRITYAAGQYLLDILTDTTERSPTFCLPPFRKSDDSAAPVSWAYLKNPLHPTPETWKRLLLREPLCLDWNAAVYRCLGAPESLIETPPELDRPELHKFRIGCENDPSRCATAKDALVAITVGCETDPAFARAFAAMAEPFARTASIHIGCTPAPVVADDAFAIECPLPPSLLDLQTHLAVKLVLNTLSTATMARMGRVTGNWMTCVEPGNKKLIDRGTRLIADLTEVDYATACERLFEAIEAVRDLRAQGTHALSPVEWAIRRYSGKTPGLVRIAIPDPNSPPTTGRDRV